MTNVISSLQVLDRQTLAERDYWLGRLSPYTALPALPRDPLQPWRTGAEILRFAAGPALTEGLARLTGGGPFLLYVTALAALKITLCRYTGSRATAVGSPPRRQGSGARLSNALVIVDEIDGAQPFRDFLLAVRQNLLDAYSRQRYPFDLLLRDLGLEWNGDGPPLFDVALQLDGIHDDLPDLGGRSQPITIELGQEKGQEKGRLTGTARFDPARYRPETIGRFVQHFLRVLEGACASTAVPVGELALLTEAEQHAVLREWNDTATAFPREATIPELFAAQAAARPDAVAVAFGDERLTYGELDRRAERLARHLRSLGVGRVGRETGPETLVALLAERSLEMVVALLGVLKAGAGYLPLDPAMPGERLAFLLEDARPAVILAQERLAGVLPETAAPVVVLLDAFATAEADEPARGLPETAPESLAYVMYTSGSTGRPKGVAVPHRAVIRLVRETNLCHFGPEETCLQAAQTSFDASTLEIWGALLNGGKVALLQGNAGSLDDVCDEVARHGATTLFLTAGMFNQMVTHRAEALRPVRQVFSGGDVMPPAAARRAVAELPGVRLANGYGPTENTGLTCRHVLSPADGAEAGVPIGRPLSNTRVYLLDRDGQPVPIGLPGELLAGGDGLARGYLGRPDLTAERWVPDPTGERPGERLYRTGDQARYLPDGRLEFLGRNDHQVKIRGFRIELGEVEAALRSHPAVRDAAVVARKGETGEQRLIAYVATGLTPGPEVKELRAFLQARLPEYMVPPVLLFLAELPVTPLGKVDRAALPEPGEVAMPVAEAQEPRTLAEELVAGIYADVLGIPTAGSLDDFFALGGHSLLATQVISRIRSAFQVDLPLRALFDSPTVAGLAAAVESARDGGRGPGVPPIEPAPRDGLLPLSFAQQRLWFVDLLEPGGWAYNIPFVLGLEGGLDTRALRWSLDEVVRRHESLRTTFAQAAGEAVQVIGPPRACALPAVDLTALPEPARDIEARRLAREDARRPFDLTAGPLLRATLVRLAQEHHALLVNLHHVISDGWSMGVLARELGALYRAARAGRPSPLPELPVQYADYAWWQRQWLSGEVLESRLGYWRRRLAGAPPTLELPADRPRPASRSGRGAALSFALGRELSDRVLALGRGESVTVSMLEAATFQALLSRYTRSEDVVLGTTIAGRPTLETEGLIGYFINTLVLRTDLAGDPSFRELLARVREVSIDAHAHEEIPFDKLVEELAPERSAGITPLVQVMLTTLNAPQDALDLPGMKIRPWGGDNDTAKFDLTLVMGESGRGLTGTFEYSTDLFDRTTVQRLAGHFRNLIAAAVAAPGEPLSSLPLLGEAEAHLVRREWNATETSYPRESNLYALFEAVAAATPDAPAVESADGAVVTYAELLRRSRQLAHRLRMYGVGPEMPVGLCVERAVDLAVGTLGIVAAGGTYVPLDPSYPSERLGWMVEDTGLIVLVADERLMSALPGGVATAGLLEVLLDEDDLGRESDGPVENLSGPGHLAYVMYTSGSTGQPKGVAVEQRGILRLVRDTDYVRFGPADRIGQVSNTSFDAATFEVWGAFLGGGCLVEVPRDTLLSPRRFASYLRERRITTMFLTAALFTQVAGEVPDAFGAMRQLLVGGDAVDPGRARAVLAQGPPERLINGYGPTEGTTFTVCHWIAAVAPEAANVPIGRPIANSRAYLLDPSLRPVPVGVPGELYAAGDGLARGYLNRPDATAERFPPAPGLEEPGARLYRTGDLARWLPGGIIEFLGRVDNQVKIRGFRIEPGEVEVALSQLAGVRQAAVVVRHDLAVGKALVGYAVLEDPDHGPSSADLRDELRRKLPDYMVPSFITLLPELPMSPNGKVDRLALPAPALEEGRRYLAPRTPEQQALAAIWSEVLGVERVSLDDDFFALGGHSLLATQVISRARTVFGVDLPLRLLFETPTLEAVTEGLVLEIQAGQPELSPAIEPVPRDGSPLPLSFAQQRLWILDQMEAGAAYNMPAALRLRGALAPGALARSLGEVVRRHEVLRTTFATLDGVGAQTVAPAAPLPLPQVDLAALPAADREAEARRLSRQDALRPFDLVRGPVVRATLLRLAADEHVALFNLHHIVSDGWSLGVLVGELSALYQAFTEGRPSPLPELPVQYADFAVWQRGWLQGEVLTEQLGYWKGRMGGASPLDLPTDRPRPAEPSIRGDSHDLALSGALGERLAALGRGEDATLFMVLLAAWTVLLHRYTGQADVVVGTPIANRNRPETEPLIGFFVNTLALRHDLGGDPSFRDLLAQVREGALGAYAHQDLPFEKLVEELQPQRDLSRTPLFQVMFALQNTPPQELRLPGLALERLKLAMPMAQFDWSLALIETPSGIRGEMEYRTTLFDGTTVLRALAQLTTLLGGIVADPGRRISELPLLGAAERQQVQVEWNDSAGPELAEPCLHRCFESQAARTPDAVALVQEDESLRYGELNRRANRLAALLLALGAGPEVPVGIFVERSPEMIVAVLAVLKAGSFYVPLDPAYSRERLAFVLEDAQVPVLLTQERFRATLPEGRCQVIALDTLGPADGGGVDDVDGVDDEGNPDGPAEGGHLAYVIYTSGSTGRPKGVAVSHRSAASYCRRLGQTYGIGPGDRSLQFASLGFDASVEEIFTALLNGATLVLRTEAMLSSVADFLAGCRRHRITILDMATAYWHTLIAELGPEGMPESVRLIFVGGEKALVDRLQAWRRRVRQPLRLVNQYGPTEATVVATETDLTGRPEVGAGGREIPIGRGVRGARVYLLDRALHPVVTGAAGELCIAGPGLARGYLGRPDLTAERFIPDPFSRRPGGRLYRTGDLARWRPEGELEFLGRIDNQVKVRGFRIELGEIEAALARHPAVHAAAVLALEDPSGDRRLAAYAAVGPDRGAAAGELRAALQRELPPYMVPSSILLLDTLPLTSSEKVDRRALAALGEEPAAPDPRRQAPRTVAEELLAGLWATLLNREAVGVEDDFFHLGGHSLLAMQLVSRVRQTFGVELPLREVFEAPTLAGLARRVEGLLRAGAGMATPPIVPVSRQQDLPLSFAQLRLWFLDQLTPGDTAYNIPMALRLRGDLDRAALAAALGEVVARHETLRTRFAVTGGEPAQRIAPPAPLPVPLIDLTALPAAIRESAARRLATEDARRPFDLARGPLLRVALLRLDAGEHAALFNIHHIVADAWSTGVLVRELTALYPAALAGRPSPLPPLPVQYADFAAWQRAWLRGEALEGQLRYWRERLAGAPPVLELPVDRPRPTMASGRGGMVSSLLPARLSAPLAALGRREGATRFMTFLAGWKALLHRSTGEADILVGTPIANRGRAEIEGLIGFFLNTLVLRTAVDGGIGLRELVGRVRDGAFAAYAHQDLPFERLVEELTPERSLAHSPLFQVMFVLHEDRPADLALPGLSVAPLSYQAGVSKFDLTLVLQETRDGFLAQVEHSSDLFDAATPLRMMEQLGVLLEAAAADPDRPLGELPLLPAAERAQILGEWNDTARAYPGADRGLHELFEAQVARSPEAVAVAFRTEELSYRELNARANRWARHLRRQGVGPEVPVALRLERSTEMVVALLAVLKAGGAYVPLDPAWPQARLDMALEDLGDPLLLTQEALAGDPPGVAGAAEDGEDLESWTDPAHLAYVIFTSGSTGRPKGAMNSHRGVVNRLLWGQEAYGLTAEDRVLQKTPYSFDVSVWEFFWPLLTGARLVVAIPGGHQDPVYLADTIVEQGITTAHFVPSMLQVFARAEGIERCTSLRRILCSGEELPLDLARQVTSRLRVPLHNLYGPTEAAVEVTHWSWQDDSGLRAVPIGLPVANVQIHLWDRLGNLVPTGVAGELCIGGVQVARGYHRRPELTAEKFVPDPFSGVPGARLYRTGDLARRRHDGRIEFLRRLDFQVKIRGVRIELGEVEATARQHPGVAEAVALAQEDAAGDKRLVVYLVAREAAQGEARALSDSLRQELAAKLPAAMVPAALVVLDRLPLTASGKTDRLALARLKPAFASHSTAERRAPRTPVEELLADVWAEVLHRESVGVDDNFFELGGHSLLATQVASRLRSVLGFEVPLRALFQEPTLAGLAGLLEAARRGQEPSWQAPPLAPADRSGPLPLSFAQERLWFLEQLEPGTALYNMPSAFRVAGPLDAGVFTAVLHEIARRHEILRTRLELLDGRPVQELAEAGLTVPLLDLAGLPAAERDAELRRLVTAEARRPFDLGIGPLLRAGVLRLGPQEHAVLVTFHHIASDGWSTGVFVGELTALYEAFAAGRPSPLPELPIQYADFAAWQRSWLAGETLEAEVEHWRRALAGAPQRLQLPTDRPRPAVASRRGASCPLHLTPELSSALAACGRRHGTTQFMTLLAGFSALLSRYTGEKDLLVGTPIAGRNHREIEGLIGFFVNTLVLRADLGGAPSFQGLLGRVRETTLTAYAHQDLPFEKLVDELAPERDLSWSPLFQAMIALQNAPEGELTLSRLTLSPLASEPGLAKFDLLLSAQEKGRAIGGALTYAADLFDRATVERLAGHLQHLLQGAVDAPLAPLSELPLISAAERAHLLLEWNDTERRYPAASLCVHELFEAQVERSPEAVAVAFEGEELTYRGLNARANRWARHLRRRGVGPEVLVALRLERSLEMVVALLAVLKAGGAYVPLDSAWPQARLEMVLEDLGHPLLLTAESLAEDPAGGGAGDGGNLESWTDPADLAYVIFTSGSTGRPKGVMNSHRGVVNRLLWGQETYGLTAGDRVLQKTPYSFDVSVWELFWPLVCGARLVVAAPGGHQDPAYLVDVIVEQGITTAHFVPSMLQAFARAHGIERCTGLKRILTSGEELPLELLRLVHSRLPVPVHNLYGPTEAAVEATFWSWQDDPGMRAVPIGRPVANTQIHLWDRGLGLVPAGVAGELCIGGVQVARGYHRRPELTAEKFVPDPFSGVPGARLYRTGDLARSRPDGQIEFLGRIDFQVKIRGVRIELGEVEAVVRQHPGVAEALVLLREDEAGDQRLVAYLVPGGSPESADRAWLDRLRQEMAAKLPAAMVPAAFVALDALPRTASGKIDRRSLPAPSSPHQAEERGFIAPRDILELRLARIWEDSLRVPRVGAKDHFFELGGHSLLAVGVVERMGRLLGRRIPVGQLFHTPRLEDLARHLRGGAPSAPASPLVRIQPNGTRPPLFWVHPVGGNVLCYAALTRHLGTDQPFYAFQAPGVEDEREPLESVEALAAHYVEEMLAAVPDGPYRLGGWSFGGVVAYEMARQLQAGGRAVAALCLLDSRNSARREPEAVPDERALVRAFAQDIGGSLEGLNAAGDGDGRLRQVQGEDLASLLEGARRAGVVPADFSLQRVEALFRVFRANRQAAQRYVPPQPLAGDLRIVLLRAEEPLGPQTRQSEDPALGWEGMARGGVEVHPVPGNHYTALHEPHVRAVAEKVAAGASLKKS